MKVLIVEDDKLWIDLLERNCKGIGTDFTTVTDSSSALNALSSGFFDGVLCDGVAGYSNVEDECKKTRNPFLPTFR